MLKITKGVILCGGYGTRFLPITKVLPKEMFPIINKPALYYNIKELIDSGIKEILIVINKRKKIIKDYFKRDRDYENFVKDKKHYLDMLKKKPNGIKIKFVEQAQQLGSLDALKYAKEFVKDEPFCLMYGDDLIYSKIPVTKQLINIYKKYNQITLGAMLCKQNIEKYGVIKYNKNISNTYFSQQIIEKPFKENAPSNLALIGRFVFDSRIFQYIDNIKITNNEYLLTDAINMLDNFISYKFSGKRFDLGSYKGLIDANNFYYKMQNKKDL